MVTASLPRLMSASPVLIVRTTSDARSAGSVMIFLLWVRRVRSRPVPGWALQVAFAVNLGPCGGERVRSGAGGAACFEHVIAPRAARARHNCAACDTLIGGGGPGHAVHHLPGRNLAAQ